MAPLLWRAAGWTLLLGIPLALGLLAGQAGPRPVAAPTRPAEPLSFGEWLALPLAAAVTLATLCWLAAAALVFLAPVLALAWLVLR
jgi:hypothetical protein